EFVSVVPMTDTTTANDVFHSLVGALDELEVDWSRAVSVATDGETMTSRQRSSFLPYPVSRLCHHPAMGGGTSSSSSVFPSPVNPTPEAA
ncbi:hypothetical protein NHX12_017069, partial [Muraenolepis orangiensis]